MTLARGRFSATDQVLVAPKGYDFDQQLGRDIDTAIAALPANVLTPAADPLAPLPTSQAIAVHAKDGSFQVQGGKLMQWVGGQLVTASIPKKHIPRVTALAKMRDAINEVFRTQIEGDTEAKIDAAITAARKLYEAFNKQYGPVNRVVRQPRNQYRKDGTQVVIEKRPNLEYWDEDPEYHRVIGAERYDPDTDTGVASELLERPILVPSDVPLTFDSPLDALPVVRAETGRVDIEEIAKRSGVTPAEAVEQLGDLIYRDPVTTEWEIADLYLAGPVRQKLAQAREAVIDDPQYARNVAALEAVQPEDLPPSRVTIQLGEHWVPMDVYQEWLATIYEPSNVRAEWIKVNRVLGEWDITIPLSARSGAVETVTWGTERMPAGKLIPKAFQGEMPVIRDKSGDSYVVNMDETMKAQAKYRALREHFTNWVMQDGDRATRLLRLYNDIYNDAVPVKYDGRHLRFDRAVTTFRGNPFQLLPHQANGVQQYLTVGNSYLAWVVGAGKTFAGAAIAVEARRLGRARKPMIVVPNHMLYQWQNEFLAMYPTARLLVADKDEFKKSERATFIAKAASQDWDAIIVKQTAFERIPLSDDTLNAMVQEDLEEYREAIVAAKAEKGTAASVKDLEKMMAAMEARLAGRIEKGREKADEGFSFEEMGVDLLIVDEAHMYKNLFLVTTKQNVGDTKGSNMALDLYYKTRYLDTINPGRFLVMLSGTPVSNSFSEIYTLQRYLQRRELVAKDLHRFDDWVKFFAVTDTRLERTAGGNYKFKERYLKFRNGTALWNMIGPRVDIQTQQTLQLPRPEMLGGRPRVVVAEPSDELVEFIKGLAARALKIQGKKVQKGEDNMLSITNDGRLAGLDMRLVSADAQDHPDSKVNLAVRDIYETWQRTQDVRGTQLIFSDLGVNPTKWGFSLYDDIRDKLVKLGVPRSEIALAGEYDDDARKLKLHNAIRAGEIRIVLTSTARMGAGTNVQNKGVSLKRLDVPYRPSDLEQSEGRFIRRGNELYDSGIIPGVEIVRYVTRGSYDEQLWTLVLGKAQMIDRFYAGGVDEVEDAGDVELSAAQALAASAENPLIPRKMGLEQEVRRLRAAERQHRDEQHTLRAMAAELRRDIIPALEKNLSLTSRDAEHHQDLTGNKFAIRVGKTDLTKRPDAAKALEDRVRQVIAATPSGSTRDVVIGSYAGGEVSVEVSKAANLTVAQMVLRMANTYSRYISVDGTGAGWLAVLENLYREIPRRLEDFGTDLERRNRQLTNTEAQVGLPFADAQLLEDRREELARVDGELRGAELSDADKAILDADAEEDKPADLPPEPRRDTGGTTLHGFADPFSASVASTIDLYRRWKQRRDTERQPLATANRDTVEARMKAAKGLRAPSVVAKAKSALADLKRMTHHYETMDPATDPIHAQLYPVLLQTEHSGKWAQAMAYDALSAIVDGLTPAQVDLMTRKLILDDIQKDIEAGLYDQRPAPFGYGRDEGSEQYSVAVAAQEVQADLDVVDAAIAKDGKVATALGRRQDFVGALTERLVELDFLPKAVLDDPRYYHRQVIAAWEAKQGTSVGGGSREVRNRKRGFMKGRTGGGDFNTRWEEAEFEWVSQAFQEIMIREGMDRIEALANIQPQLKRQANAHNIAVARARWAQMEEDGTVPTGTPFPVDVARRRIAMNSDAIYEMVADGTIPLEPTFIDLMEAIADYVAQPRSERGTFSHPDWWRFLTFLATANGPGAQEAASTFKAIHERDKALADLLGDDFQTWEDLVPDTHRIWQPVKGNYFHMALTIEERTLADLLATAEALKRDDIKTMLVMGGPRTQWVIPTQLANTMDNLGRQIDRNPISSGWRKTISAWKVWQLLNPLRVFKYNFNNLVSDAEAAILFPGIYKHVAGAAADVSRYMTGKGRRSAELKAEMQELIRLRVMDGGLSATEITDIGKLPAFKRLAEADPLQFMQIVGGYWEYAKLLTSIRENILRVAAYRYFLEHDTPQTFAASRRQVIQSISNREERAAMLASDLLGDYGGISAGGQQLRETLLPFFSWIEVSARRYINLFRNLPYETGSDRTRILKALGLAGAGAAVRTATLTAYTALLANAFLGLIALWNASLVALWNALFIGDDEDELQIDKFAPSTPHILIGRGPDGELMWVRAESGFADFLEWLGLSNYMADIRDVAGDDKTFSDLLGEAARAPISKIVGAWEPGTKTGVELLFGRKTFPDPWNTRPIRNRWEYLASQYSLGSLYRAMSDLPTKDTSVPWWIAQQVLPLTSTDPGEAAYWAIREKEFDWLDKAGKGRPAPEPRESDNALYYYRTALRNGDESAAALWLQRYYELGGTPKKAREAVKRATPLNSIPIRDRAAFLKTLDENERLMLDDAKKWYDNQVKEGAKGVMPTVTFPSRRVLEGRP
jgi:N12 class adenine-specific DNA methylase